MRLCQLACATALMAIATTMPAYAAEPVDVVISQAGQTDGEGRTVVDLLLANGGTREQTMPLPPRVEAKVDGGDSAMVWLDRAPDQPTTLSIPAGGFARARYRFTASPDAAGRELLVSIPAWGTQQVALTQRPTETAEAPVAAAPPPTLAASLSEDGTVQSHIEERSNRFFDNFSAYQSTYVAYGKVEDSELRVQVSFKYQIAGSRRQYPQARSWSDGLYFGFTHRIFWNFRSDDFFRDANYLPELFYRTRAFAIGNKGAGGFEFGVQHESNGRAGPASRSLNTVYVAPTAMWDLGSGYSISASPRLTFLIGGRAGNPDIRSYRGVTGLNLQVGKDDGLRLSAYSRYNFSTGKGAISTELSYPLPRLLGGGPDLYLFAQSFAGYGESLFDYNRRMTRLRFGLAITR